MKAALKICQPSLPSPRTSLQRFHRAFRVTLKNNYSRKSRQNIKRISSLNIFCDASLVSSIDGAGVQKNHLIHPERSRHVWKDLMANPTYSMSKSPLPDPDNWTQEQECCRFYVRKDRATEEPSNRQKQRKWIHTDWKPEWTDNQAFTQTQAQVDWADRQVDRYTHLLYLTKGISVMAYLREEAPSPTPCRSVRMPWAWEHAVERKTHTHTQREKKEKRRR